MVLHMQYIGWGEGVYKNILDVSNIRGVGEVHLY